MKKLDPIDLEILAELYGDSRITNKELAAKVKIAPSTCLERVKRLHVSGVIKSFCLELDLKAVGCNIEAMTAVRLGKQSSEIFEQFRASLLASAEVIRIYHMGGENDFLLHIAVKDTQHLRDFIFREITSRKEVVHIETALIYEQATSGSLPIFN